MSRLIFFTLPQVARELKGWQVMAQKCTSPELRTMALASLDRKRFHCQGGSLFAAMAEPACNRAVVQAIVAVQTISDYLDNLCDSLGVEDGKAFHRLHLAFLDALAPGEPLKDYYGAYPYKSDGGYLARLVVSAQKALGVLPSYQAVQEETLALGSLYCRLQATKHLAPAHRERLLAEWLIPLSALYEPPINWWELAAATGSTLGIFDLFALASRTSTAPEDISLIKEAYFPWISALHILLDYLIDLGEDRQSGDFNFVSCYPDLDTAMERLLLFWAQSEKQARQLPDQAFHLTVVQGLLALYLSDPKVEAMNLGGIRERLLRAGGAGSRYLYRLCHLFRRLGVV